MLQEAIRYHLAPGVLLPALLKRTPEEVRRGWAEGRYYEDARRIAASWIRREWPTYLRLSSAHLWGLLTAANFLDDERRAEVWRAVNALGDPTWAEAPLRTDYPLNRFDERLSPLTGAVYGVLRCSSAIVLLLGIAAMAVSLARALRSRPVSRPCLALALTVASSIAHSIPAALFSFPEPRFTYANLLTIFAGAAAGFAYRGAGAARSPKPSAAPKT